MTPKLKQYFPMIRTRRELLQEIEEKPELKTLFLSWEMEQQEEFLDFMTGVKGVKLLYDSFFKEIMNPETVPERLEDLLSLLLGKQVKILYVLPNDNTRIAEEGALLITDIVVELEEGGIVNVEIQKIGYAFPGERSACYSADLLLRQYKRARSRRKKEKKQFTYRDIKGVYTIVLFENSPKEFHAFPEHYVHFFQQHSNTGLKLELLQKYVFIPLDIFRQSMHNKGIKNKLDGWLAFLSVDEPATVAELIRQYPEFRPMYEHVYDMCRSIERVMDMFSKELRELDRNTVQYMIDEMQDTIDEKNEIISKLQESAAEQEKSAEELKNAYQKALERIAQLEKNNK